MNKVILLICDGMGDRPLPALEGKTPLEWAKTPNLDRLAEAGISGLMNSLDIGMRPGSDTSHLCILGYDYREYYPGRGPIEVAGLGMKLKGGDVALRGNVATVDEKGLILDRRAGRIGSCAEFVTELNGLKTEGIEMLVQPGTGHRCGIILRGKGLSSRIKENDPHEPGLEVWKVKPLDDSEEAAFTAKVLNDLVAKSHEILKKNPGNDKRISNGEQPVNYLLVRGAGLYREIPLFQERFNLKACCIAGGGLYRGIGALLGMEVIHVPGATGKADTDLNAKAEAAVKALDDGFEFCFLHFKGTDLMGEDGNAEGKAEFIERIDRAVGILAGRKDTLIAVTADHSTPCALMQHSGDPVPLLISGDGVRQDAVTAFGERNCMEGGLGRIKGVHLMPEIINLLGKAELVGA